MNNKDKHELDLKKDVGIKMNNIGKNKLKINSEDLSKISGGKSDDSKKVIKTEDLEPDVNEGELKVEIAKYGGPPIMKSPINKAYGLKKP